MADVIFCVLLMLPIWLRISFPTAICHCLFKLDSQMDQQARTTAGLLDLPALSGLEFLQSSFEAGSDVVVEVTFRADLVQKLLLLGPHPVQQLGFELHNLVDIHIVQEAFVRCEQYGTHFRNGHRAVLVLLHQLGDALTVLQLLTGCFVEVGSELGKRRQFPVLGQGQTDVTAELLHDLGLGCTTYPGYGDTGVHGRTDTGVEQVGFQEDLTIGNGDYVGRYEGRNVTSLGFDDRQCGQGTGLAFHFTVGELLNVVSVYAGSALQQTGVQIENVTRVCFTSWRTTQQQGDLTVGNGLLGQVIVYDQCVFTAVAEELTHGGTGVRSQELHGSRIRGTGSYHDGVVHSAVLFELAHNRSNRRLLLTNRNVDTLDASVLLVDDRVARNGSLTNLTVTDDQLTLTTTDWNHGVDRFQTSLYRLVNRLTSDNARCNLLNRRGLSVAQLALAVDRVTQTVYYTAQQFVTNRYFQDTTSTTDFLTFGQVLVVAQNNRTNRITLKVQRHTVCAVGKFNHLAVHNVGQTVNQYDTVRNRQDRTFVLCFGRDVEFLDSLLDDVTDLGWIQLLHAFVLKPCAEIRSPEPWPFWPACHELKRR